MPVSKLIFKKYDKDGSGMAILHFRLAGFDRIIILYPIQITGMIDSQEFRNLCYELGHYLSDEQVVLALQVLD